MNNDLIKAMLTRKSVRNFDGREVPNEKKVAIKEYINDSENYKSVYGSKVRFEFLEQPRIDTKGLVTNAPAYVIVIIDNNNKAIFDAGYVFEKFILFLESLGLATCYLNSGFQRDTVELETPLKQGEVMILASPVGFEGGKKSKKAKGCDLFLRRNKRRDIDETFFADKDKNPIVDLELRDKMKYLTWAPSGLNTQPWRVIFEGDKAHFYIDKQIAAKKRMGFDIHFLDIGIVVCHYVIAFNKSKFITEENPEKYEDMDYVVTVE